MLGFNTLSKSNGIKSFTGYRQQYAYKLEAN